MSDQSDYDKVMARALKLLSVKARTVAELRERLLERAVSESVVEQVIARLQELRYLNDEQFAADYSASRLRVKPLGRRRLSRELAQKKVPEPVIENALDQVYELADEETFIDQAIEKRLRTRGRPRTRQEAKNLFDHLRRLGFDYELVRRKVYDVSHTPLDEDRE
ncbi:MAG: regulatory protein RecX [Acidobacteria bacterium]|nr:regulatory protein RecX [Acidobacteriota bacterium]